MREGDGEPSSESMQGEGRVQIWFSVRPSIRSQSHARTHAITRLARASERSIRRCVRRARAAAAIIERFFFIPSFFSPLLSHSNIIDEGPASESGRTDGLRGADDKRAEEGGGGMLPKASCNMRLKNVLALLIKYIWYGVDITSIHDWH